jgi:Inward rectifier potassium channel C-terminal domain
MAAALQTRAEVVVTFVGTTEFGNPFMARQSYTALEIHWGSMFKQCVYPPKPGNTRYTIDIAKYVLTPSVFFNRFPGRAKTLAAQVC